jgi:integrase
MRVFQTHLFRERKLNARTVVQYRAALRFFFVKTLQRHYLLENIPLPKEPRQLPTVLSQGEVTQRIEPASNLMPRAIRMTHYATGWRRAELCQLKVSDIDKERMVIHIRQGKGQRDRDVDWSESLWETLREYWRWMKPKTYWFPGTVEGWRADVPITGKVLWACRGRIGCHHASNT